MGREWQEVRHPYSDKTSAAPTRFGPDGTELRMVHLITERVVRNHTIRRVARARRSCKRLSGTRWRCDGWTGFPRFIP